MLITAILVFPGIFGAGDGVAFKEPYWAQETRDDKRRAKKNNRENPNTFALFIGAFLIW
jgi:hypothetical protein